MTKDDLHLEPKWKKNKHAILHSVVLFSCPCLESQMAWRSNATYKAVVFWTLGTASSWQANQMWDAVVQRHPRRRRQVLLQRVQHELNGSALVQPRNAHLGSKSPSCPKPSQPLQASRYNFLIIRDYCYSIFVSIWDGRHVCVWLSYFRTTKENPVVCKDSTLNIFACYHSSQKSLCPPLRQHSGKTETPTHTCYLWNARKKQLNNNTNIPLTL